MGWVRTVSVKNRNDQFEEYQGGKVRKTGDVGGEGKGEVMENSSMFLTWATGNRVQ